MLFAVEIILHEVSARTLVPVFIATTTATYIGQLFFGPHPSFFIPALETPFFVVAKPLVLVAYAGLGVIAGAVSVLFIWSIYGCEAFFERLTSRADITYSICRRCWWSVRSSTH